MAADSTVNIDVILHKEQAQQASKELDQTLKDTGKDAGNKAKESIEDNVQKASEKTKELVTNINRWVDEKGQIHVDVDKQRADESIEEFKERIKRVPKNPKIKPEADTDSANEKIGGLQKKVTKIPKEVRTELIAQAKSQGIENFDKLLRKLPKEQRTELIAKAQKGEAINYEELLRKIPARIITEAKLNDHASLPLRQLQTEAKETSHSFSQLKDVMAGTFLGGMAIQGLNGIKNGLIASAKAGMQFNIEQDRMKTVWTALTTEAPRDGKVLINYINDMAQHSIYAADTIDRMAQSFYHVHSSVKETKDWTNGFIRLGSTLHMSNDQLAEAGEQFAKIVAGGKANAEDMSVMINRFPMFGEALQKATGKSMKQLYEMSAQGKLTAKDFTEALDYLSNKYKGSTEEAMTSFTGMSMYIKSRWQMLWGEVTSQGFKGSKKLSEDMRDILSDKMIAKYASLLSEALGAILKGVMAVLDYVGNHKDTIVDVIGNLGKIVGLIGSTIWQVFADIIKTIAAMFGLTSDKSKGAHGALEDFDNILKAILDHKDAIKAFTVIFMAIFATKKIYDSIDALTTFYGILKNIVGLKGIGGVMKGIGAGARGETLATSAEEVATGGLKATRATKIGRLVGRGTDHLFGITKAHQAVAGPAFVMENGAGKAAIRASERGIIRRTASRIPVVGSLIAGGTELIGINKQNRNEKIGRAVGATGGTAAGGVAGAWIGGALGSIVPGAGTAVGAGVGSLIGSTVGGMFGAKGGGAIGKNISKWKAGAEKAMSSLGKTLSDKAKEVGKTVGKAFQGIAKPISKVWSGITKPIVRVFNALKKTLGTIIKGIGLVVIAPFVLMAGAIIKAWQKLSKPIGRVVKAIGKTLETGWKKISKATSKAWQGITKVVTRAFGRIKKPIQRAMKVTGKVIQSAWNTISKTTSKVWRSLSRTVLKAVNALYKPISRIFNAISRIVGRVWNGVSKSTGNTWREVEQVINRVLGGVWKFVKDKFDDMKDAVDDAMNGIKHIWDSIWDAISDKVSAVWDTIKGVVSAGINAIGGFWNTGASGLEKVAGFFGAKVSIPRMKKLASGTGGRQGEHLLAMVNDQEGPMYREAIFRNNGRIEIPTARNVLTHLQPGEAVMPAKETAKMFGIPRFEGGFGDWFGKALNYASSKIGNLADMIDDKLDAVEDALKDPLGTLVNIYTHGTDTAKVMWHDIAEDGARNKIPHYAETWFTNLLKKAEEKLEEVGGSGPVSPSLIRRAAHKMKVDVSAGDISHIMNVIQHESGGRSNAVNNWDSNAAKGTPSKGILQFIDPTFQHYAMPGHTNIFNAYDQLLAMFNDTTWRSDLTLGGWSPSGGRRFANGGWSDKPAIFGEIKGEPELVVNPKRDSSEEYIAEAIEARAKVNPNGFAGNLSKIINEAKQSANNMLPFISTGNNHVQATSNTQQAQPRVDGNINITMNIDSKQVSRAVYPTLKAMRSHEVIINGVGGAVPVGNGQPLGGVY
ncbi:tape measure protein [Limosilactobacillus reuteri]|uniref:tape measure protein n=1 Tax=Limosilactobacillus reuteri TaxID=1598 RepID=UPI001E64A926|nr:tape measure protein [Limosilactobacillus reuteri]MCC4367552.1 tape measure protein [Limosilactobacillus reuteri]